MSAEIIRGVPFGKKRGSGGGDNDGREGLKGVLSVDFFYNNFIRAIDKGKTALQKERIFQKLKTHYKQVVLNPTSKHNLSRPQWVSKSRENLDKAIEKVELELKK